MKIIASTFQGIFHGFCKKSVVVTCKKWHTEALPGPQTEQKEPPPLLCFKTPEIRATHLAHSSLQNRIKTALRSISVAGNLLFLNFFVETVNFIR